MNSRKDTYKKYVFRRVRRGREEIFARVGYRDKRGKWRYVYRIAKNETEAEEKAKRLLARFRFVSRPPAFTDEELTEIFFGILDREITFREFKRKILGE